MGKGNAHAKALTLVPGLGILPGETCIRVTRLGPWAKTRIRLSEKETTLQFYDLAGKTRISRLCFGCEPLGGTDWGQVDVPAVETAVRQSLEHGINFFDTADVYGLGVSEERLSDALGSERHNVVIATKGGIGWSTDGRGRARTRRDSSPAYIRQAVHDSLRRLKLDHLPLYYIHWPDPETPLAETFDELGKLQDEGKIGLIGCSNFNLAQLKAASEHVPVAALQLPMNILAPPVAENLCRFVGDHGISLIAYNVLAAGLLTGKYQAGASFGSDDRRHRDPMFQGQSFTTALDQMAVFKVDAQDMNQTLAQYAIGQVLAKPQVAAAIVGVKNSDQLEANLGSL